MKKNSFRDNLKKFIEKEEGRTSRAYRDATGFSIGIGHFILPTEKHLMETVLTEKQIDELFEKDIEPRVKKVEQLVKVPINENQKIALVSLLFNIGETNFANSTLLRKLNLRDFVGASLEFSRWKYSTNAQGVKSVNNALVLRREREKNLFIQK
jgi:lysozyme